MSHTEGAAAGGFTCVEANGTTREFIVSTLIVSTDGGLTVIPVYLADNLSSYALMSIDAPDVSDWRKCSRGEGGLKEKPGSVSPEQWVMQVRDGNDDCLEKGPRDPLISTDLICSLRDRITIRHATAK